MNSGNEVIIGAMYHIFLKKDQATLTNKFTPYKFGKDIIFTGTILDYAKKVGIEIKIKIC